MAVVRAMPVQLYKQWLKVVGTSECMYIYIFIYIHIYYFRIEETWEHVSVHWQGKCFCAGRFSTMLLTPAYTIYIYIYLYISISGQEDSPLYCLHLLTMYTYIWFHYIYKTQMYTIIEITILIGTIVSIHEAFDLSTLGQIDGHTSKIR